MDVYHRKLYALLRASNSPEQTHTICTTLNSLKSEAEALRYWWCNKGHKTGELAADISSSSDRVNLPLNPCNTDQSLDIRHPISGEEKTINAPSNINPIELLPQHVIAEADVEKVFWWFWRLYPELTAKQQPDTLLLPAHRVIPDTPVHSYASTVSAVVGTMFPQGWESGKPETPYLLLFTFSPVQEFIKSSRKFVDFWAGSYLLHYLSAKLCWYIAEKYGSDAVITPSLWGQEIIDALIIQNHEKYSHIKDDFESILSRKLPVELFKTSTSLSTAGFPNIVTALVHNTISSNKSDKSLKSDKYNGVMFSSRWLADDMNLQGDGISKLRVVVDKAHKDSGFGDGSPGDWWVIVLADGDGMGDYVSGKSLNKYDKYIIDSVFDKSKLSSDDLKNLLETKKRMGPATHVGLNRALLDFSNRLVPYLTEKRFCGKVVYSGGDDVMAVLPLEDLPEYLLSLRAAWSGKADPHNEFADSGGYWKSKKPIEGLPNRSLFTMGKNATMSVGIVIAYKSVPLPTVLENIWQAEKERAKKIPKKDGLCFRVIYGGGNTLEAVMKGELLEHWYKFVKSPSEELSPLLFRLAEEIPKRASITEKHQLFAKVANIIMSRRDESKKLDNFLEISNFLVAWEDWVKKLKPDKKSWEEWSDTVDNKEYLGTHPDDLGNILRFSAFWTSKMVQRENWKGKD